MDELDNLDVLDELDCGGRNEPLSLVLWAPQFVQKVQKVQKVQIVQFVHIPNRTSQAPALLIFFRLSDCTLQLKDHYLTLHANSKYVSAEGGEKMRNIVLVFIAALLVQATSGPCLATEWREAWSQAMESNEECNFTNAVCWFDMAISVLETTNDQSHPAVYIDRAEALISLEQYEKAISDLNMALHNSETSSVERSRAHLNRLTARTHLARQRGLLEERETRDGILEDLQLFAEHHPNKPQMEITEKSIVLRNTPDCDCYKKLMKFYFLRTGACQSERDIKIYDSGTWIIHRNPSCDCSAPCLQKRMNTSESNCKEWCQNAALVGWTWCGSIFRTKQCQAACALAVNQINNGCYWCCARGEFYRNCIAPFSDIIAYMGRGCDPLTD